MSGGPLTDSLVVSFTDHLNRIVEIGSDYAVVEPGVFYRDLELRTLAKGRLLPCYPASKNICTVGGMVNNNAAGEKTLKYGATRDYVQELKVVLRDGNEYSFKKISADELKKKISGTGLESEVYRRVYELIEKNYDLIKAAKPAVSKNSAGYALWDVWDRKNFDLTQLFVGSQGTLGLTTQIRFKLVPVEPKSGMVVIFMKNYDKLPDLIHKILAAGPDSLESFDRHTFDLALKFFPSFAAVMGLGIAKLVWQFMPEFLMVLRGGVPTLTLLVEFEGATEGQVQKEIDALIPELKNFPNLTYKIALGDEEEKYWAIRRESFNLLRQRIQGKHASPFIDDTVVNPEVLPEFLPELYQILDDSDLLYTIAGHVGNGNFHIIPLMDLSKPEEREKIWRVSDKVFELVLKYKGSITGEHNDGIVRSPYLPLQFGSDIYHIFAEVKNIFDPERIFNPHKKIGVTKQYAAENVIKHVY
jgi:FAD/FMN-containing dehydrogenase